MSRESLDRVPALAAAAAFHVGVLFLAILLGQWLNKPEPLGNVTSVTLMTSADVEAARAAMQADQQQQASTPEPSLQAPETSPAPQPAPTPAPAPPTPVAAPQTTQPASHGTPRPTTPPPMDWDKLSKSLQASSKQPGGPHPSLPRGPPRPSTSPRVIPTSGPGTAASQAAGVAMGQELSRLWIQNCGVMGGSDIKIVLHFRVGPGGRLIGQPVSSEANATDPLTKVASDRAVRAVYEYFSNPPPDAVNLKPDNYTSNFNPKQDCTQQ
jgi:periplasmic protein TonB